MVKNMSSVLQVYNFRSILCLFIFFIELSAVQYPCLGRNYGQGSTVCVCNSTYCDTIPLLQKIKPPRFLMYISTKDGLRFHRTVGTFRSANTCTRKISIDSTKSYQTIFGWGGAFTDASGININSLPEKMQDMVLKSYFSEDGIEYNMGRVPMGASDFSERLYSYDDKGTDPDLINFALAPEDFKYKIPLIKKAMSLRNELQLFTVAWTAPKWMKTNRDDDGSGYIIRKWYQAWANYFVKFLDEYQKHGISFWGITTGNEPNNLWVDFTPMEVVMWPAWKIGEWISNHLGPTIRNSNHSNIKIMILEDQIAYLPWYIERALQQETARSYIDGISFHWYRNYDFSPDQLTKTHKLFPEKFILQTEASNIAHGNESTVALGSWERGEYYSTDIIETMLHWVNGWLDWNMVLDLNGGPNCIRNFVDAPIIVNGTGKEFYKQPMYYHLGHFSKFVPRGSTRIYSKSKSKKIKVVAFRRPDNGTVVVVLNMGKKQVLVKIQDRIRGCMLVQLKEKSINTVLYW